MLLVNECPFLAGHPSGELTGPRAPLAPNAGCEELAEEAVEAEVAADVLEAGLRLT